MLRQWLLNLWRLVTRKSMTPQAHQLTLAEAMQQYDDWVDAKYGKTPMKIEGGYNED